MKKSTLILTLFLIPFCYGQSNYYNNVIRIIVNDSLLMPKNNRPSSSVEFGNILQSSNVNYISKPFYFAKTKELQNCFEVYTNSNLDSLISRVYRFGKKNTGKILSIERIGITKYLSDPIDNFWSLTTDSSFMWYLKKIEADLAWDITKGDTSVKVAIIDKGIDITHPDLIGKVEPPYDFYTGLPFSSNFNDQQVHGTSIATLIGAETKEIGQANGQMPSVGYNTKMMFSETKNIPIDTFFYNPSSTVNFYSFSRPDIVTLYASTVKKAKVINISWYSLTKEDLEATDSTSVMIYTYFNSSINSSFLIEKEILNNGTSIVRAAGNLSENNPSCNCPTYPFSGIEDERTIVVSGTDYNDNHQITYNGQPYTHSHYPEVDLCAPSYGLLAGTSSDNGTNPWPYATFGGTSQSAPLVVGTIALMYAINPCLSTASVQDILKQTTDPITDAASFPGLVGTGRLNTFRAVQAAQMLHSSTLDLYIKDCKEDLGSELYPYNWQTPFDQSSDIWVRNQNDGFINKTHENPEYTSGSVNYVYVRVRNKSCVDATTNDSLKLYWTKAANSTSWPQNWNGSNPTIGNKIGAVSLNGLKAGKDTIIMLNWSILNPYIYNNWQSCLLARIESPNDPMNANPNYSAMDIFHNNNLSLKNCHIVNIIPGMRPVGEINGGIVPFGSYVYLGNGTGNQVTMDINFVSLDSLHPLSNDAEIKLLFDENGWSFFEPYFTNNPNFRQIGDKQVVLTNKKSSLKNVVFNANERFPVYFGFSLYNSKITVDKSYLFDFQAYKSNDSMYVGGEHFTINSYVRAPFDADAGSDKQINPGQSVTITAEQISEAAIYNWYDTDGNLIYTGKDLYVSPEVTKKYNLEVIALSDGTIAKDEVEIKINPNKIVAITPNPTNDFATINYNIENCNSAYIMLLNQTGTEATNYLLNLSTNSITVNMTNLVWGSYTAILICDGVATDAKMIIKQ
jgi:subtilisin family serine protease